MIDVEAQPNAVRVTVPTTGMTPQEISDFLSWLRVESAARRSRMSDDEAWKLSEEIKSGWWAANEHRFRAKEGA